MTCIGNAARASNLQNITIYDLDTAEFDHDFDCMCIRSQNYKTSLLYGEKKLLFGNDLFKQLQFFVTNLRPLLITDDDKDSSQKFVFTSAKSSTKEKKMSQSTIANALTRAFEQARVFSKDE